MLKLHGQNDKTFLFCPFNLQNPDIKLVELENRLKNSNKNVHSQNQCASCFQEKAKTINFHWTETIADPKQVRAIDVQKEHSRSVVATHFEVEPSKTRNSAHNQKSQSNKLSTIDCRIPVTLSDEDPVDATGEAIEIIDPDDDEKR